MTNHPDRKPAGSALPANFRQALAEARGRAALSQTAAAKLLGAGLRTWQQWEAGDRAMPVTALELWCITAIAEKLLPVSDAFACMWVRPSVLSILRRA